MVKLKSKRKAEKRAPYYYRAIGARPNRSVKIPVMVLHDPQHTSSISTVAIRPICGAKISARAICRAARADIFMRNCWLQKSMRRVAQRAPKSNLNDLRNTCIVVEDQELAATRVVNVERVWVGKQGPNLRPRMMG